LNSTLALPPAFAPLAFMFAFPPFCMPGLAFMPLASLPIGCPGGGALVAGGGIVCMPALPEGAGTVSAGFGGVGGVGGMVDCGVPGGDGGIGVVGEGGVVSVGFAGGAGGTGWFCASRAPETSSEPAARADSNGLRDFIIDTPCQNGARVQAIDGAAALPGTLTNDL
jgi:hypothetical protein